MAAPVGQVLDLGAAGFHEIPAPPIEGGTPTQVWTGDELVVWGGEKPIGHSPGAPSRTIDGGATLNLDDGRWTPMPPSPLNDGLYGASGVWDGHEVVIIGTRCTGDIPDPSIGGVPTCPRGPAAIAWNPEGQTWRKLPAPPIPLDTYAQERIISGEANAVGAEGKAIFTFARDTEAIAWDSASGSWTTLDRPWTNGSEIVTCVDPVGQKLVAIERDFEAEPATPGRVWTIKPAASTWSEAPASPVTIPRQTDVSCGHGTLVTSPYDVRGPTGAEPARGWPTSKIISLATGAVSESDLPAGDRVSRRVQGLGPWVFATANDLPDIQEPLITWQGVRRIDAPRWLELHATNETSDLQYLGWPSTYVDVGTVTRATPSAPLGFWRAPQGLQGN